MAVATECRLPEVAATFYEVAVLRTSRAMGGWLRRRCELGLIILEDTQAAAGMLRGMMIMEPQRTVMRGQQVVPSQEDIAARAKYCVRLFLEGCGVADRQSQACVSGVPARSRCEFRWFHWKPAVHDGAACVQAYCAMPLPKDQFSFFTSTSLMKRSSRLLGMPAPVISIAAALRQAIAAG
jgi:hypothetical protein